MTSCTYETELKLIDTENLLKAFSKISMKLVEVSRALNKIDHMSNNPNVTSNLFDSLHNEISDRDTAIARLILNLKLKRTLLSVLTGMQVSPSRC